MGDSGSGLRAFVAELRRRRVFRVAVVYAIVTFVILQVADIAFPALQLPEWTITFVVALALLGFPIAMVLAWAFDITAQGVRRTEPLPEPATVSGRPSRAAALTAVSVVLGLTLAAGWVLLPKLPGIGASRGAGGEARKMVLVLPFVNLGGTADEFFADGITEEITARLSLIKGLGVIARTTATQYRNTDKTVREIGEELGVEYVLEGTVRWEEMEGGPSRVRVTPQLIRVADATHVWVDIYEEPISSVFQVQSDIAEKVADALDVTLLEPERLALEKEPTENLEAYTFYLAGNEYMQSSSTETGVEEALQMFERALELDPGFELAEQKLAEAHANLYWARFRQLFGFRGRDSEESIERLYIGSFGSDTASYYLAKAILLDRASQGALAREYFDSARLVLEPRVAFRPGDSRFHAQLGLAYAGLRRAEEAVREGREATRLLPMSRDEYAGAALADNLAHIYVIVGDHGAAVAEIRSLMTVDAPMSAPWLRVDPTWDPLRDDPLFQQILEENS